MARAANRWDVVAFPLIIGILAMAIVGFHQTMAPIGVLQTQKISLDPSNLPEYALRTTLRMLAAMVASLVFTLVYGTLAAKSRRAGMVLIPILDILQSVPVLGYISFTVTFFLALFPGRVLGAELAAIFAIFTSQAWNMTFSFYQSLRTVPRDLSEVSRGFHLTPWQRFWKLEVPFSMPGLIWNMMMSMSGGWFFVVASEAITVGNQTITLPGIGAYLAQAISDKNLGAVGWVIVAMSVVILAYDQFLFRPLVAWADKFRMENTASGDAPQSWLLDMMRRTHLIHQLLVPAGWLLSQAARIPLRFPSLTSTRARGASSRARRASATSCGRVRDPADGVRRVARRHVRRDRRDDGRSRARARARHHAAARAGADRDRVGGLGAARRADRLRPALAEKIQPLAQFLAAFPANLLFPVFVIVIVRFHLNADIWLSPLIVLGTQWYILFNVIAGAMSYPNDYKEATKNFRIRGWQWWRQAILPGIFPYYVTGAITASGGAWNASIVSEFVQWGDTKVVAHGLGSYIAQTTAAGDFPKIILGIAVMSLFVTLFNRLLWRPMYAYAESRLRLD